MNTNHPTIDHPNDELDVVDVSLIAAFVRGENATRAAAAAGVSVSTAYRRSRNPAFVAALGSAMADVYQPVANAAVSLVPTAFRRLRKILRDPTAKASDHVAAAKTVFDAAMRFTDVVQTIKLRELTAAAGDAR